MMKFIPWAKPDLNSIDKKYLINAFNSNWISNGYYVKNLEKSLKVGDWKNITGGAKELDEAIISIYGRRRALAFATAWRTFGLIVGSGQVMLVFYFLGYPITFVEAIMLESLGHAIRNMAFMIPGALGVQEGGFMLLGYVVGAGSEIGLVFSLIIRARSLVLGLPGLIVWQFIEGRKLLSNHQ